MKTGLKFDYSGFLLFGSLGLLVVQNSTSSMFLNNLFLQSFFKPQISHYLAESLQLYGVGIIFNFQLWSIFFRELRSWLLPFRRFRIVRFELWGLGLRFQPVITQLSRNFLNKVSQNAPSIRKLSFRYWRFKIGLSHKLCFFEDLAFKFILRKSLSDFRRRVFFAISNSLSVLYYYCTILRSARGINVYKYRGLKYSSETIKLKIGKAVRL